MGNEHNTSGLLQRSVYRNKKKWKPKQQVGIEKVENKKTTTKNKTTQTEIINTRNEPNTSGLLQRSVYINLKKWKPKQ
jgi:hypothetical protein